MTELFLAIAFFLQTPPAPPVPQPADAVTDKEAADFCQKLEKGLLEGRAEAFDGALNMTAMLDAATRGLILTPTERVNFRAGVSQGFALGRKLIPESGNSYRFLGFRTLGQNRGPVFRFWTEDGLNYHLLKLKKAEGSGIRIADIHIFVTSDWLSSIFRLGALGLVSEDPERRAKLERADAEQVERIKDVRIFQKIANQEDPQKALEAFRKLPESTRNDRLVQAIRMLAANKAGEADYLEAEADFKKLFPQDASIHLMTLDGYVYRKDFAGAILCVDRLDKSVGGDPLLNFYRGNMLLNLEKYAEAKKMGQAAAKDVPYLQEPRWLLVTVALKEKEHKDTARLLTELERDFKLVMENLEEIEDYADFVKSQEYRDWKKSRTPAK